ncbi:MAG: M23 family metallopeptidase, partial [Bacteroidales bacterium]
TSQNNFSSYSFITETYQIPGYDLYSQYWDVENIRSEVLEIPFSEDQLRIILVQSNNNDFVFPCMGQLYMDYGARKGKFHPGVDLKLPTQAPVKSCFDGVVRMAKNYGDYGNTVVVRHYNGLETIYAHLHQLNVRPGQIIQAGEIIGISGNTGNAPINMLHFEIRFLNEYFNPAFCIDFNTEDLMGNTLVLKKSDFNIKPIPLMKEDTSVISNISPESGQKMENKTEDATLTTSGFYVVKPGDTLYKISRMYNISVDKLLKINNITDGFTITVGQKIKVQ